MRFDKLWYGAFNDVFLPPQKNTNRRKNQQDELNGTNDRLREMESAMSVMLYALPSTNLTKTININIC